MIKKQQQGELPGMPKMDPLAEAACEYLNGRGELLNAQESLEKRKQKLIAEFNRAGKDSIRVSGFTLTYQHKESDTIVAKGI